MSAVRDLLHPNVFNFYNLPEVHETRVVAPQTFLNPARLDVIARYVYVRQYDLQQGLAWGMHVYKNLLECWNRDFQDGDGSKHCFNDYLRIFNSLIDDVRLNGFQRNKGLIPHAADTIIDGAHRLAACLYYDCPIEVVEVEGARQIQDAATLLKIGMNRIAVEQLVQEYLYLDERCRIAILPPCSAPNLQASLEILGQHATIVYTKELHLGRNGRYSLVRLLYGHEGWWRDDVLADYVALRFSNDAPVTVAFLLFPEGSNPITAKEEVRTLNGSFKHSIHINDTHTETKFIADMLLNPNGLHFLNNAAPCALPVYDANLGSYLKALPELPRRDNFCIDSSAVLALYGIRDARDIDYISADGSRISKDTLRFGLHNEEYPDFPIRIDEIVYNPNFHFRHYGAKYMSFDMVAFFKRRRGEEKDKVDVRLMSEFDAVIVPGHWPMSRIRRAMADRFSVMRCLPRWNFSAYDIIESSKAWLEPRTPIWVYRVVRISFRLITLREFRKP